MLPVGELQEIMESADGQREVRIYYTAGITRQWEVRRFIDGRMLVPVRIKGQDAAWDYAGRFVGWE